MQNDTNLSFYQSIKDSLAEESDAGEKYAMLAKKAPSEEFRNMLMSMARQEIMHHAQLECMLLGNEDKI